MHMVEKILNNTTPYGKIKASHEGSLHSSTLTSIISSYVFQALFYLINTIVKSFIIIMVACVLYKLHDCIAKLLTTLTR